VALFIVLALAVGTKGSDPVSAYTYAYTFMQVPYAVVAISVMSAVTPDLAERWATKDLVAFRRRLSMGLRATLALIVPIAVTMLVLAHPLIALFLGHGSTSVAGTSLTGSALALFCLGLPGFCTYLYVIRVLQAMQRTRVAFYLYVVENGCNIIFALLLIHPLGVRGLALSVAIAYSVGAVVGLLVLRRWLGHLSDSVNWAPLRRVAIGSAVAGVVEVVIASLSTANQGVMLFVRVGAAALGGATAFCIVVFLLGARNARNELGIEETVHVGVGPIPEEPTAAVPMVESSIRWVAGTTLPNHPGSTR
jgi:putative peptidoglycan lipid II flippase